MTRLGLLALVATLGACSPYVQNDSSAAAGASARPGAPLLVRVNPDGGGPEQDRPAEFDDIKDGGRGIAGSPETVIRMLRQQLAESGANYFVGQFAFGDIAQSEAERSVALFTSHVMPALRQETNAPGG